MSGRDQFPADWFKGLDQEVQGWCSAEAASVLWEFAGLNPELGAVVEIGSAWGKSTIVLAEASRRAKGGPVYSVDPHTGGIGYLKQLGLDKIDSFPAFWANIVKYGLENEVVPFVATSEAAAAQWDSNRQIRLLYIDGLHTPEAVTIDIIKWIPLVSKGGLIILDDYDQPTVPLYRAKIDEMLPTQTVTLPVVRTGGGLVFVRKE